MHGRSESTLAGRAERRFACMLAVAVCDRLL